MAKKKAAKKAAATRDSAAPKNPEHVEDGKQAADAGQVGTGEQSTEDGQFTDGEAKAQRTGDATVAESRFRARFRELSTAELELHDDIKETAEDLLALFEQIPHARGDGIDTKDQWRDRSIAIATTKLEEAVMWAVKGLTR